MGLSFLDANNHFYFFYFFLGGGRGVINGGNMVEVLLASAKVTTIPNEASPRVKECGIFGPGGLLIGWCVVCKKLCIGSNIFRAFLNYMRWVSWELFSDYG